MTEEQIVVGKLRGAHGIGGELKAEILSDHDFRFAPGSILQLEKSHRSLEIERSSPGAGYWLLKFAGIDNREQAQAIQGLFLLVPRSQAAPLPRGSYYHWQLIGLKVMENGRELGIIREVQENPANDLYIMEKPDGKKVIIPALKEMIQAIEPEKGEMQVQLPPGLED